MQAIFIKLDYDFNRVMSYRNGKGMKMFDFRGVRLLPNQPALYIQRTDVYDGIIFDNPTVEAMSMCGEVIQDITDSFEQIQSFEDPDTGFEQIYWGLKNLPDLGERLIYLRITNGADGVAYSTPFMVHGVEENDVPPYRFDYREDDADVMQSTGLEIYYYEDAEIFEQETFDTIAQDNRVVMDSKLIEYEVCRSGIVDYKLFRAFKKMMCFNEVYCDFQRAVLIETFDTPDLVADENFVETEISLLRDASVVYDPFYVPPVPPPPPPYGIVLQSITPVDATSVYYTFEVEGFTPTYLTYQYSLDQINWTNNTSAPDSPHEIPLPNYATNAYYYRIYSPEVNIYSNVVQLAPANIVLTKVYSLDAYFDPEKGNKYIWEFQLNNFIPQFLLQFQYSVDGVVWQPISNPVGSTNSSPRETTSTPSSQERKFFRIRYPYLNLTSNVYEYEI